MKRSVLIVASVLAASAVGALVIRYMTSTHDDHAFVTSETPIPDAFLPLDVPEESAYVDAGSPEGLNTLAERIDSLIDGLALSDAADSSVSTGARATIDLLSTGDIESYTAYRGAFGCTLGTTAEPLANQQFKINGLADIDQATWDTMSPQMKFDAIAADPDQRNATILKLAPAHAKMGFGMRGSIPLGYRIQGMNSVYLPLTPDLIAEETESERAWVEIPVKLDVTDEALLRFEYVLDPGVNAWVLYRASLLAPELVKLPWIVL